MPDLTAPLTCLSRGSYEISNGCLASISSGRYEVPERAISRRGRLLSNYLHENPISDLDARQLSILRQIHTSDQQAIGLIEGRKK